MSVVGGSTLEHYKAVYVASLRGETVVANQLLTQLSDIVGKRCTIDYVCTALWNCMDLLPEEDWERFCFANERSHPVRFAYAARLSLIDGLFFGFIDSNKVDAAVRLWEARLGGLEPAMA